MEWLIISRMELLAAQIKLHTTNISIFFVLRLKFDMSSANSLQIPTSSLTNFLTPRVAKDPKKCKCCQSVHQSVHNMPLKLF